MSSWPDVRLVAEREAGEKLRSRTFVLSSLFFLVLVAVSIALPALLVDDGPAQYDVAVVGTRAEVLVAGVDPEQVELDVRTVPDDRTAAQLVRAEEVDVAVAATEDGLVLTGRRSVPGDLVSELQSTAVRNGLLAVGARAGLDAEEVQQLLTVPVQEVLLDDRGLGPAVVPLLSAAFGLLFFFIVFQFGYAIAQGVVQEKESRVVELLVSAVPIRTLLYGKVLGLGALAMLQVLLVLAVALAGAGLTGEGELLALLLRNSGWFLLFFVLGFALLACLWAAAGAFASRSEDLQSTTTPLMVLVLAPLFAALYAPDGVVRTVLSYVPLSSPLLMPVRLIEGDAAPWEAALAALLLLGACVVSVRVGERLYRASLLRTRGRTTLRQAWSGQEETAGRR